MFYFPGIGCLVRELDHGCAIRNCPVLCLFKDELFDQRFGRPVLEGRRDAEFVLIGVDAEQRMEQVFGGAHEINGSDGAVIMGIDPLSKQPVFGPERIDEIIAEVPEADPDKAAEEAEYKNIF